MSETTATRPPGLRTLLAGADGLVFAFLCYAVFSISDATVKGIGPRLSPIAVLFALALFQAPLVIFLKQSGESWRGLVQMRRPGLVLFRSVAATIAGVTGVYAFTSIPLAEAYALLFVAPALAVLMSAVLLKEHIGWRGWCSVVLGFIGVLVVMRPGFHEFTAGHLAAALCSVCIATSIVCLRLLGTSERPSTTFAMLTLVNLALCLPLMGLAGPVVPDWRELWLLVFAGVTGGLGQLFLMSAVKRRPANQIAPAQYSQLGWAILFGAVFFHEFPDAVSFAGLLLIGISGLFLVQRRIVATEHVG